MVDYLKVLKTVQTDNILNRSIIKCGYADKVDKLFSMTDKASKYVLMSLKALSDIFEEIEKDIENDSSYSDAQQLQVHLLILKMITQFQDTVVKVDADAITKDWDWDLD